MNKFFFPKIAAGNLKKNAGAYLPYILTCVFTIMMFYCMRFLATAREIGSDSDSLRKILSLGSWIIGIFACIFLFYTNSFLIRRRKKEFGLFNILGMEKKHIALVMFFETLFTAFLSLTMGILGGILFSKLLLLLVMKVVFFSVSFGFEVPAQAVGTTLALFSAVFLANLLFNIFQVHLSNPTELLKGENLGEREPKSRWLITAAGALCLGYGYYISVTTKSPMAAFNMFFLAVILVIIGTYCLFISGSVTLLKVCRKNKSFYYKPRHFISISGMIYRMKQNAAGLANICILSTAVIVMLSTTISMYIGFEDILNARYPQDIMVEASGADDSQAARLDEAAAQIAAEAGSGKEGAVGYRFADILAERNGAGFTADEIDDLNYMDYADVFFIPAGEYNRTEGTEAAVSAGEALLYVYRGEFPGDAVSFNGTEIAVRSRINEPKILEKTGFYNNIDTYVFIVKDEAEIHRIFRAVGGAEADFQALSYYSGFDVAGGKEKQIQIREDLQNVMVENGISGQVESKEASRGNFYEIYGGLLFLGIFLGILFIMATVLIIYYKQLAEGFDDRERYAIMQNVGMSHAEVRASISSQVLSVFFLPLAVAVIHLACAFPAIRKMLAVLNLTNVPLYTLCTVVTILVFAVFYTGVYALTARKYYRIVSNAE